MHQHSFIRACFPHCGFRLSGPHYHGAVSIFQAELLFLVAFIALFIYTDVEPPPGVFNAALDYSPSHAMH